jgi:hypothetical protein
MGEFHPADRKVVVEFCPKDLTDLTDLQRMKLKKLAGARYNPEKDIVKMSCERFEHQAQNKRYLGDTVQKLIEAAKVRGARARGGMGLADRNRTRAIRLRMFLWIQGTTDSSLSPSSPSSGA